MAALGGRPAARRRLGAGNTGGARGGSLVNALTAKAGLDALGSVPGARVAVTGAAGARSAGTPLSWPRLGLTLVADTAEKDRDVVAHLGADHVLPRGDGFADRVRTMFPNGVDGSSTRRGRMSRWRRRCAAAGPSRPSRSRRQHRPRCAPAPGMGLRSVEDTTALEQPRDQAVSGALSLRVAAIFPEPRPSSQGQTDIQNFASADARS
jgi:hypothetical protein